MRIYVHSVRTFNGVRHGGVFAHELLAYREAVATPKPETCCAARSASATPQTHRGVSPSMCITLNVCVDAMMGLWLSLPAAALAAMCAGSC
jgi:hypothetical protein